MILLSSLPCFMVSGILWSTVRKCLTFIPVSVSLSSLNTWNFLSVESKEGTFVTLLRWHWNLTSEWVLVASGVNLVIGGLEFSVGTWLPGREEELDVESITDDFINHISVMKPPRNPKDRVQKASELVNPWRCWENGALERAWKLQTPFPYLSRTCL